MSESNVLEPDGRVIQEIESPRSALDSREPGGEFDQQ